MDDPQQNINVNEPIQPVNTSLEDESVVQGRIFWLPSREEVAKNAIKQKLSNDTLWKREVRRAHSSGAIDEGIYNHPVVVVSRPQTESRLVHFFLITSFGERTLDEMWKKSIPYQASRRTWFLPVAPTPKHPDAVSEAKKKRFPTLKLANDAILRKNSYVDIRNVYQIDWSLLWPYKISEAPDLDVCGFDRGSMAKMLAKCKTLVEYEPKEQLYTSKRKPRGLGQDNSIRIANLSIADPLAETQVPYPIFHKFQEPEIYVINLDIRRIAYPTPKVPPDETIKMTFVNDTSMRSWEHMVCHGKGAVKQVPAMLQLKYLDMKQSFDGVWVNTKGVIAVTLASL